MTLTTTLGIIGTGLVCLLISALMNTRKNGKTLSQEITGDVGFYGPMAIVFVLFGLFAPQAVTLMIIAGALGILAPIVYCQAERLRSMEEQAKNATVTNMAFGSSAKKKKVDDPKETILWTVFQLAVLVVLDSFIFPALGEPLIDLHHRVDFTDRFTGSLLDWAGVILFHGVSVFVSLGMWGVWSSSNGENRSTWNWIYFGSMVVCMLLIFAS